MATTGNGDEDEGQEGDAVPAKNEVVKTRTGRVGKLGHGEK